MHSGTELKIQFSKCLFFFICLSYSVSNIKHCYDVIVSDVFKVVECHRFLACIFLVLLAYQFNGYWGIESVAAFVNCSECSATQFFFPVYCILSDFLRGHCFSNFFERLLYTLSFICIAEVPSACLLNGMML